MTSNFYRLWIQTEEDKRLYKEEKVINEEREDEEVDMVRVYPEELRGKFKSKLDVYNYLKQKWQLFLPRSAMRK